jgi:predicted transcriptional regulator
MITRRTRRDATKVIYEILALGIEGASKTQIIYKGNLSFRAAEAYTYFLFNKGFLRLETDSHGLTKYWLTESGVRLLRLLRSVETELREFFLGSL